LLLKDFSIVIPVGSSVLLNVWWMQASSTVVSFAWHGAVQTGPLQAPLKVAMYALVYAMVQFIASCGSVACVVAAKATTHARAFVMDPFMVVS
jgi:hypothetical protein